MAQRQPWGPWKVEVGEGQDIHLSPQNQDGEGCFCVRVFVDKSGVQSCRAAVEVRVMLATRRGFLSSEGLIWPAAGRCFTSGVRRQRRAQPALLPPKRSSLPGKSISYQNTWLAL